MSVLNQQHSGGSSSPQHSSLAARCRTAVVLTGARRLRCLPAFCRHARLLPPRPRRSLPLAKKPANLDDLNMDNIANEWQARCRNCSAWGGSKLARPPCHPPPPCRRAGTHNPSPPLPRPAALRQELRGATPDWCCGRGRHFAHPDPLLAGLASRQALLRLLLRLCARAASARKEGGPQGGAPNPAGPRT